MALCNIVRQNIRTLDSIYYVTVNCLTAFRLQVSPPKGVASLLHMNMIFRVAF